jgi:hypothetical protein
MIDLYSVLELQKGLNTATEYVSIMERAQEYAECVAESLEARAQSEAERKLVAMMACLFISAWESLCRFQSAVYKQAYRNVGRIREGDRLMFSGAERERALAHQLNMAEQCCASRKGLILAEHWGNQRLELRCHWEF